MSRPVSGSSWRYVLPPRWSIAVAVALRILFTRTRAGITMRAVVDDRDLTARSGSNPLRSAQLSWALGASIAALASILIAPLQNFDQFNLTILVVIGYAAAVVGRLKNLPAKRRRTRTN